MNSDKFNLHFEPQVEFKYNFIGDPIKVKQIFLNIIENLVKAAEVKSDIHVSYNIIKEGPTKCEIQFKIEITPAIYNNKIKEDFADSSVGEDGSILDLSMQKD
ncbi:MAG: sensor histidine kinase [Bacteroidales bacterium]|nr:sensor histidine kinase [Bacteroidales bacterium]